MSEENKSVPQPDVKFRQILIETDGDKIHLRKAEVSGTIELVAILNNLVGFLTSESKKNT